jgi:hypothetical protein
MEKWRQACLSWRCLPSRRRQKTSYLAQVSLGITLGTTLENRLRG